MRAKRNTGVRAYRSGLTWAEHTERVSAMGRRAKSAWKTGKYTIAELADMFGVNEYNMRAILGIRQTEESTPSSVQLDDTPTNTVPGQPCRIAVYRQRAERGLAIFHPDDATFTESMQA